ncbi:F-box/FBD/LRR-repeat protein At5g56420-like [Coffea arabica]|uniref:F-box/FBD/LRR-repeat protein At5g56420-like n=1 Tax=Coffea arabica TaxID=13443 RepID=A0A6P6X367_COFAR|nr:uncharacterized protein LOC113737259 [Coffea arabica]
MASMDDMPEDIINHISSFLSYKQATKTSVLSKSWLNAWRARPTVSLTLDYENFSEELREEGGYRFWDTRTKDKRNRKFSKHVRRTLKNCTKEKMGIDEFMLVVRGIFMWDSLIKRCLQVAVKSGVKKFYLDLCGSYLPEIFFEAKSVVDVSLREVELVEQSMENIRGFDHLKRLSLYMVQLDNVTFEHMISCCQSIEILEITYCGGDLFSQYFDVPDLDNLWEFTVKLKRDQSLILHEAPNLESLFCSSHEDFIRYIDDWTPCWLDLRSSQYKNLKTLVLYAVGHCYKILIQMEHRFPHLENLTIQYCQDLKRIRIKSDSLKEIRLADNWGLNKAQFDTPSIVRFVFADNECKIIPVLSFIAASGHWTSDISISWVGNLDTSWFFKLQRLLASLVQSKISVSLEVGGTMSFDFNEIRDNLTYHGPQEVHELTLNIHRESLLSSPVPVLDVLFQICRPKTIRQHWSDILGKNIETLKLLYDGLMLRKNQEQSHNLQQLKFWQNNLKGLKVEIFKSRLVWEGDSRKYYAGKQSEQQLEALDWENFLKVVNTHSNALIHFGLEWKASVEPEGTKRKATDKPREEKSSKRSNSKVV